MLRARTDYREADSMMAKLYGTEPANRGAQPLEEANDRLDDLGVRY